MGCSPASLSYAPKSKETLRVGAQASKGVQSSASSFTKEGLPALEDRGLRPFWVGSETQQPVVERQQRAFGDVLRGGGASDCFRMRA